MTSATMADGPVSLRERFHATCCVCGNPYGLGLRFEAAGDGSVVGQFACPKSCEGYEGVIHGGVVASLLDGAMTNCLFLAGHRAVTADLRVRFRHPLRAGIPATIRARITRSAGPLFYLAGEVIQEEQIKARGMGTFFDQDDQGGSPCAR